MSELLDAYPDELLALDTEARFLCLDRLLFS